MQFMKSILAFSALAFSSTLLADADSAKMRHLENRVTALEQRKGASGVINPSGRPQLRDGSNLFLTGDLLLWQAHEDGIPLFIDNVEEGAVPSLSNAHVESIDWSWDWGFRFGVGYNSDHDGWDLYLNWMRVYGRAHQHEHTDLNSAYWPTLAAPSVIAQTAGNTPYYSAHAHWRLELNQLDLELGREFFVSKWLTLRPHFGLRTDWIRQKLHVDYERPSSFLQSLYHIKEKSYFWGVGLAAGIDTQWGIGEGFSVYGNAAFATLYGFQRQKRNDVLNDTDEPIDLKQSDRISRFIGDLQCGLRWDKMWDQDRFHIGLQVGWEHHLYFNQNQFPRFVDNVAVGNMVANQGDLTFQGWTFSARFDF